MSKTNYVYSFILKLKEILNEQRFAQIIEYRANIHGIFVYDEQRLEDEVLPIYFSRLKFDDFVERLNIFGFTEIQVENGLVAYKHPFFDPNDNDSIQRMKRQRKRKVEQRRSDNMNSTIPSGTNNLLNQQNANANSMELSQKIKSVDLSNAKFVDLEAKIDKLASMNEQFLNEMKYLENALSPMLVANYCDSLLTRSQFAAGYLSEMNQLNSQNNQAFNFNSTVFQQNQFNATTQQFSTIPENTTAQQISTIPVDAMYYQASSSIPIVSNNNFSQNVENENEVNEENDKNVENVENENEVNEENDKNVENEVTKNN